MAYANKPQLPRPPQMDFGFNPYGPSSGDGPGSGMNGFQRPQLPQFPRMGGDSIQYPQYGTGVDLGRPPEATGTPFKPTGSFRPVQPAGPTPPAGGGPGGWEWINGQWGHNLPTGGTALPQPPKSTPAAPGGPQQGSAQVQGPITPTSIYTPQMTAQAVNQAVSLNTPDSYEAMKAAGSRPGVSRGPATAAAAAGYMGQQQLAGNQAAADIPLLDAIANQRNLMAGEQAASGYGFDTMGVLGRLQGARDKQYFGNAQQQISLLDQLMGSLNG